MYRNLKAELARKGLTQNEFCKLVGLSSVTFGRKIRGEAQFNIAEAKTIKKCLNYEGSLDELFEESN